MSNAQKGILLTLLSAVFNGSTYVIVKLLLNFTNVETILVLWFSWGILIFVCFFYFSKKLKEILRDLRKHIGKLALLGMLNSLSAFLWSYGVLYGNPASVSFIFRLEAVFSVLLAIVLLKEKLSKLEWVGVFLAVVGAFMMMYQRGALVDPGNLIMLAAAIISATLIFLTKIYVKTVGSFTLAFSRTFFLFAFLGGYAMISGKFQPEFSISLLGLTAIGALVGAFLGFFLFFKSLSFYGLSKAVAVRSIEPFFAVIFSLIILGLFPTLNQLVGGVIIIGGVIILSITTRSRVKNEI